MELADEGIRAGFALAVLVLGATIKWYGTRLISRIDRVVEAVEHHIPERLAAGDHRMGAIEHSVDALTGRFNSHVEGEDDREATTAAALTELAQAIRAGDPVGRAAE